MPRKPLGSQLKTEWLLQNGAKKTVRRTPPNSVVSFRYEVASERLQAVGYKEHGDTIYFELKGDSTPTIGYVRFNFQNKKELNIDFLEVYEPFRKKGYGREIYGWTESYAKSRGVEKITVISLEEAVGFWKKMGLKRGVWSKPGYISMVKALSDS
jgi:GNAT superfamily N-acetyltransferase